MCFSYIQFSQKRVIIKSEGRVETRGARRRNPRGAAFFPIGKGMATLRATTSMKILDVLDKWFILLDMALRTKEGVLREMVHTLVQVENQIHEDRLMEILLERESPGEHGNRRGGGHSPREEQGDR